MKIACSHKKEAGKVLCADLSPPKFPCGSPDPDDLRMCLYLEILEIQFCFQDLVVFKESMALKSHLKS